MTIDDEVIEDLLAQVEQGAPLRAVCQDNGVPDIVVLQTYLRRNPAIMDRLRLAKLAAKKKIEQDAAFKAASVAARKSFIEGQANASEETQSSNA